ncbi:MAG: hypothetical protein MJ238_04020 [Bacilli bacterium]|nr:hypothetical protein [Bacilli bacterium]
MDENNTPVTSGRSPEEKKAIARNRTFWTILALDAILVILVAVSIVSIFTGSGDSPVDSEPETSQIA